MVTPLSVAFFGTPAFAVPTLRALLSSVHRVVAVVTQPDRPRGRGQRVSPEAVKRVALEADLPVLQPGRLDDPDFGRAMSTVAPDLGVVAAYGRLLPDWLLAVPRFGLINVHASLLPRWRGAAPVHRAILAGDTETGVTIMRVVQALDAGPMLAAARTPISPDETSAEVEERLAVLGAGLLVDVVDRLAAGTAKETWQDEAAVTFAPRLDRRDSQIDWARPAVAVHNQIRGLHPWPLAGVMLRDRRVRLLRSVVAAETLTDVPPGTVLAVGPDGIEVAALPGAVRVTRLQQAGGAAMSAADYLRGHRVQPGDVFLPLPDATE